MFSRDPHVANKISSLLLQSDMVPRSVVRPTNLLLSLRAKQRDSIFFSARAIGDIFSLAYEKHIAKTSYVKELQKAHSILFLRRRPERNDTGHSHRRTRYRRSGAHSSHRTLEQSRAQRRKCRLSPCCKCYYSMCTYSSRARAYIFLKITHTRRVGAATPSAQTINRP